MTKTLCTTEIYFIRKEEDAEVAARKIGIRVVRSEPRSTAAGAEGSVI